MDGTAWTPATSTPPQPLEPEETAGFVPTSVETPSIPAWAAGLWDRLRKSMKAGDILPLSNTRYSPHKRIYTKAYADGRQKKGGGLHAMLAKEVHHVERPAPKPSAKARTRFIEREKASRRAVRQALFGNKTKL